MAKDLSFKDGDHQGGHHLALIPTRYEKAGGFGSPLSLLPQIIPVRGLGTVRSKAMACR